MTAELPKLGETLRNFSTSDKCVETLKTRVCVAISKTRLYYKVNGHNREFPCDFNTWEKWREESVKA